MNRSYDKEKEVQYEKSFSNGDDTLLALNYALCYTLLIVDYDVSIIHTGTHKTQ